jgi:hypothetical protein
MVDFRSRLSAATMPQPRAPEKTGARAEALLHVVRFITDWRLRGILAGESESSRQIHERLTNLRLTGTGFRLSNPAAIPPEPAG